jgi:hypothetical protein
MDEMATTCTHPSAQRDTYRNNGRLFTYCRACDSDLSWTADIGRGKYLGTDGAMHDDDSEVGGAVMEQTLIPGENIGSSDD